MAADGVSELIRSLVGPLELEARHGYPDTSVIGNSLGTYAREWVKRARETIDSHSALACCEEIERALSGYDRYDVSARKSQVQRALRLLSTLEEKLPQPPPKKSRAERCRPKGSNLGEELLQQERVSRPGERAGMAGASSCPADEMDDLDAPLTAGRKSPPAWARRLANLGIHTNRDLLYHFPREYVPFRRIAELVDGERAVVTASVVAREEAVVREARGYRLMRYSLEVSDAGAQAWVTSFARVPRRGARGAAIANSPLSLNFAPGTRLLIDGSVRRAGRFIEVQYLGAERLPEAACFEPTALMPVYPLTDGVYQGQVRSAVRRLMERMANDLPDPLPRSVCQRYNLTPLAGALRAIHFPTSQAEKDAGIRRMAFEELLTLQVALAQRKGEAQQPGAGIQMQPRGDVAAILEEVLPFSLTKAQRRVISEIAADMASDRPMHRLIQGDVGSGKTVIAAAALMIALQNGFQGALMAPTELLAEQHYLALSPLLRPLGVESELLTGSVRGQDREEAYHRIASGRAQIVMGTHALIQEGVEFHRLGLVIIDEQHRFGVRQRAQLRIKGARPDTLVMTATPIPRTLALTLYGDLDLSVLDEMPPGRRPVKTWWLLLQRQREAYEFVRQQVRGGRQAYVVCPLVEESEKLQAEAAVKLAEQLRDRIFPDLRVGLIHGAMRVAEKDAVMQAFRTGEIDVLTATTVIEVGVDVPNATVMLVHNAERFGLAQLHQLRGRVGRGAHESHCMLLSGRRIDPSGRISPGQDESLDATRRRLEVLVQESDGFRIAEEDLLLRGPGECYGTRQHGLPDLRLARLAQELGVLDEAREAAFWLTGHDPRLEDPEHLELRERVRALRTRMDSAVG